MSIPDNSSMRLSCARLPAEVYNTFNGQSVQALHFTGIAPIGTASPAVGSFFLNAASATLTFSAQPTDGQTVVIGARTYTFKNTLTTANHVKIGFSTTSSRDNLIAAINADAEEAGSAYYSGTTANADGTAAPGTGTDTLVFTSPAGGTISLSETISGSWSTGTLTSNAREDETVTIGSRTYTFKTALAGGGSAGQVLIGATSSATLDNLVAAILDASGEGTLYGTGTTVHPDVSAQADVGDSVRFTALVAGSGGNAIALSHTCANGQMSGITMGGGASGSRRPFNGPSMTDPDHTGVKDGDYFVAYFPIGSESGGPVHYRPFSGYVRRGDYFDGSSFGAFSTETGFASPQTMSAFAEAMDDGNPFTGILYGLSPVILIYHRPELRQKHTERRFAFAMEFPDLLEGARLEVNGRAGFVLADLDIAALNARAYLTTSGRMGFNAEDLDLESVYQNLAIHPDAAARFLFLDDLYLSGGYQRAEAEMGFTGRGIASMSLAPDMLVSGTAAMTLEMNLQGHEDGEMTLDFAWLAEVGMVVEGQGLSVKDIALDVLNLFGFTKLTQAKEFMKRQIVDIINAAHQEIYSRARELDYFNRQTIEVQIPGGQDTAALPVGLQMIQGTVRFRDNPRPLKPLKSRAQLQQFSSVFLGAGGPSTGEPVAYYIHREQQPDWDSAKATLCVAPAPVSTTYVLLDVSAQPTRYFWRDVDLSTPLRLPHAYAETLLMPLCRQRAVASNLYNGDEQRAAEIRRAYEKARETLGLVDPAPDAGAKATRQEVAA